MTLGTHWLSPTRLLWYKVQLHWSVRFQFIAQITEKLPCCMLCYHSTCTCWKASPAVCKQQVPLLQIGCILKDKQKLRTLLRKHTRTHKHTRTSKTQITHIHIVSNTIFNSLPLFFSCWQATLVGPHLLPRTDLLLVRHAGFIRPVPI